MLGWPKGEGWACTLHPCLALPEGQLESLILVYRLAVCRAQGWQSIDKRIDVAGSIAQINNRHCKAGSAPPRKAMAISRGGMCSSTQLGCGEQVPAEVG